MRQFITPQIHQVMRIDTSINSTNFIKTKCFFHLCLLNYQYTIKLHNHVYKIIGYIIHEIPADGKTSDDRMQRIQQTGKW